MHVYRTQIMNTTLSAKKWNKDTQMKRVSSCGNGETLKKNKKNFARKTQVYFLALMFLVKQ